MKEKLNINQIPTFKQAILDLPEKEKNKLLIRLINKDQLLIEQLHFKLLEDEYDLIKRFEDLKSKIEFDLTNNYPKIKNSKYGFKGKLYYKLLRSLSGAITHYAKVTKDVNGELQLRTFLLIESTKQYSAIQQEDSFIGFKLRTYQVSKIKAIIKLYEKLHEDLKHDFSTEYFDILKDLINTNYGAEMDVSDVNIEVLANHFG